MIVPSEFVKALDEAALDEVKKRFVVLCENLASGETAEASVGMFAKGIRQILQAHTSAQAVVDKIGA